MGGRFLLRIEDIDATRCRPEFETAIYEDLAWLGIAWEEPVRRQSEHLDAYRDGARRSWRRKGWSIRASRAAARSRGWSRSATPRASGRAIRTARRSIPGNAKKLARRRNGRARIAAGEPYALRLDMNAAVARTGALTWVEIGADPKQEHETLMAQPEAWGDVVLARKDTPTSYHLSVVVDDALQGVTHVVRGQDLFRRPACTACCRRCSACRRRSTIITG